MHKHQSGVFQETGLGMWSSLSTEATLA